LLYVASTSVDAFLLRVLQYSAPWFTTSKGAPAKSAEVKPIIIAHTKLDITIFFIRSSSAKENYLF
jgi:hypothetical protein